MTIALIGTVVLITTGFLVLLDRKDRRHYGQVERLCQRIQAPELAVVRHDADQAQDEPAGAPPVLDEEYLREHREAVERIQEMEALENAQFDRA